MRTTEELSTNDAAGDAARSRVERRVAKTHTSDLTAAKLDEIVLQETGTDESLKALFRDAEEARFAVEGGTRAALNAGTSLNCFGLLAVVAAAAAWGGVFGQYESPGWTWMLPALAPVVSLVESPIVVYRGRPGRWFDLRLLPLILMDRLLAGPAVQGSASCDTCSDDPRFIPNSGEYRPCGDHHRQIRQEDLDCFVAVTMLHPASGDVRSSG